MPFHHDRPSKFNARIARVKSHFVGRAAKFVARGFAYGASYQAGTVVITIAVTWWHR